MVRNLRLVSKFMTSQPGKQTIAMHILPNISTSKSNEIWKVYFFKNYAENEAGRLVPDLFSFFEKALHEVKASGLHLSFNIF